MTRTGKTSFALHCCYHPALHSVVAVLALNLTAWVQYTALSSKEDKD
jgi:hypothetical protein